MFKVTFSGIFFADGIDLDETGPADVFVSNSHGQKNYKKFSRIFSLQRIGEKFKVTFSGFFFRCRHRSGRGRTC